MFYPTQEEIDGLYIDAAEAWNREADKYNQWCDLGLDERNNCFASRIIDWHMEKLRQQEPDGWQLVPVEPTLEIVQAAQDYFVTHDEWGFSGMYRAMLAAAPKVAPSDDAKDVARYRWLRQNFNQPVDDETAEVLWSVKTEREFDAAIDAAMRGE